MNLPLLSNAGMRRTSRSRRVQRAFVMKLGFEEEKTPYQSPTQSARFWSESWVRSQVYCPNCGHAALSKFQNNRPVADFHCASCSEEYELKSQKANFGAKVVDGAFRTMCERVAATNNPNLMLMNYDVRALKVKTLCVVPKHFFVRDIIQARKSLAATARRAGWVGCNILLKDVPEAGKIFYVKDGHVLPKDIILQKWQQTLFLRRGSATARGWVIEVLKCVEAIGRREFNIDDVYTFERRLSILYPNNRHIKQKIRQQLQVLRDHGYIEFVSRGVYRLRRN
jgi:type II restriction enzyme